MSHTPPYQSNPYGKIHTLSSFEKADAQEWDAKMKTVEGIQTSTDQLMKNNRETLNAMNQRVQEMESKQDTRGAALSKLGRSISDLEDQANSLDRVNKFTLATLGMAAMTLTSSSSSSFEQAPAGAGRNQVEHLATQLPTLLSKSSNKESKEHIGLQKYECSKKNKYPEPLPDGTTGFKPPKPSKDRYPEPLPDGTTGFKPPKPSKDRYPEPLPDGTTGFKPPGQK